MITPGTCREPDHDRGYREQGTPHLPTSAPGDACAPGRTVAAWGTHPSGQVSRPSGGRVVRREQAEPAALPGDGRPRVAAHVLRVGDAGVDAAVGEGDLDTAVGVGRDVDEVEQVAVVAAGGAAGADGADLDRVARRRVGGRPGLAAVVGGVDVEVPHAVEVRLVLVVAAGGGAEGGER